LYVSDVASKYTRPARELKGFRKISLQPGERSKVEFTIGTEQLQYIGQNYKQVVEPGLFRIMVGRHVNDTLSADLTVQEG
ncbi:beta-glucosidase, partial [Clostridium perfringens]